MRRRDYLILAAVGLIVGAVLATNLFMQMTTAVRVSAPPPAATKEASVIPKGHALDVEIARILQSGCLDGNLCFAELRRLMSDCSAGNPCVAVLPELSIRPAPTEDLTGDPPLPPSKDLARMQIAGAQVASLPEGQVATDAPSAMTIGEAKEVDATVGIKLTDEQLKANERPGGQHTEDHVKISYEMVADLTGPGFKIERMNAEKQIVVYRVPTVWSWKVEGTQEGEQDLTAVLYDIVPGLGENQKVRISSYVQHIKVAVRAQTIGEKINAALKYITEGAHAIYAAIVAVLAVGAIFNKRIRAFVKDLKPADKDADEDKDAASDAPAVRKDAETKAP